MKELYVLLLSLMAFAGWVQSQSNSGFISIDCGLANSSRYDSDIDITYVSDTGFIDTGVNIDLPGSEELEKLPDVYETVRSFPNGTRNCYKLQPVYEGNKYLMRAYFFYGNYDGKNSTPRFDLYIGVNLWQTISEGGLQLQEIITVAQKDFISICLINTGHGTPFISGLELRLLNKSMYSASNDTQSLIYYDRRDLGRVGKNLRHPQDPYDRIWYPQYNEDWARYQTSNSISTDNRTEFLPPEEVMKTAIEPLTRTETLSYSWNVRDSTLEFFVFCHFAELEKLGKNETREFNVCYGSGCTKNFRPPYLVADYMRSIVPWSNEFSYIVSLVPTTNSTLPPILNAIEIYTLLRHDPTTLPTQEQDVEAILNIQETYNIKKDWISNTDPCLPKNYSWDGIACSYPASNTALAIISLNLSSSGLSGQIAYSFGSLKSIKFLDLSRNNLTGTIPDFLGYLPSLSVLDLSSNQLHGLIPNTLQDKFKEGSLKLSIDDNPNLCWSDPCNKGSSEVAKKKSKIIIPIVASVASMMIVLTLFTVLWALRRYWKRDSTIKDYQADSINRCKQNTRGGSLPSENWSFTHTQVVNMTNNFQRTIGRGGFGIVYHGQMRDGTQVAVKVLYVHSVKLLSHSHCQQGPDEFHNEAQLLMRVHHKNLVRFIGYCQEGDTMALIYEYMAQGNLGSHLSDKNGSEKPLTWIQRLHIALDIATGLEYLHKGCKPPIIHRDIKATNILLNEKLEAKIGDFGLSKVSLSDEVTHISTNVKGSHGYLDPEYCKTNNLTEKSDVYSYGVILLQLITGQPAIIRISNLERISIIEWANAMIARADIGLVVDTRLDEQYGINSAWKAIEIALACTTSRSIDRPTMTDVIIHLKDCLKTDKNSEGSMREQLKANSGILAIHPTPK